MYKQPKYKPLGEALAQLINPCVTDCMDLIDKAMKGPKGESTTVLFVNANRKVLQTLIGQLLKSFSECGETNWMPGNREIGRQMMRRLAQGIIDLVDNKPGRQGWDQVIENKEIFRPGLRNLIRILEMNPGLLVNDSNPDMDVKIKNSLNRLLENDIIYMAGIPI